MPFKPPSNKNWSHFFQIESSPCFTDEMRWEKSSTAEAAAHEKLKYRRAVLGQAYYGLKENLTETQVQNVRQSVNAPKKRKVIQEANKRMKRAVCVHCISDISPLQFCPTKIDHIGDIWPIINEGPRKNWPCNRCQYIRCTVYWRNI